jgi:hypothetical protein
MSHITWRESGRHVQHQTDSHVPFNTNMQAKKYGCRSSGKQQILSSTKQHQQGGWFPPQ